MSDFYIGDRNDILIQLSWTQKKAGVILNEHLIVQEQIIIAGAYFGPDILYL